jgi:hypothetical protein
MNGGRDPLHQLLVTISIERNRFPESPVIEPGWPSAQLLGYRLIAREDVRVKRWVRVAENLIVDPKGVRGFQLARRRGWPCRAGRASVGLHLSQDFAAQVTDCRGHDCES